jgi:hypothetical protein
MDRLFQISRLFGENITTSANVGPYPRPLGGVLVWAKPVPTPPRRRRSK